MTDKFLKAKHWQLFLFTFGIPIVIQFIMMGLMISNLGKETNTDPTMIFSYLNFFPIMMLVFLGVLFGWFWSVAIGLQSKIPENVKMKVKKFKVLFFIPMVYMLLIILFMGISMNQLITIENEPNGALVGILLAIVLPIHFLSMV